MTRNQKCTKFHTNRKVCRDVRVIHTNLNLEKWTEVTMSECRPRKCIIYRVGMQIKIIFAQFVELLLSSKLLTAIEHKDCCQIIACFVFVCV